MENVDYWRVSSQDNLTTAKDLFTLKHYSDSLLFVHLSLEKILKAVILVKTNAAAPPVHDLVRLAERAGLALNEEVKLQLAEISTFNIAARYDDYKFRFYKKATLEYAKKWLEIGFSLYSQFEKEL